MTNDRDSGRISRDDLALYVMGSYDGDAAALEAQLAGDEALREQLAEEAELELLLRDAAAAATFCPACDDLVRGERCAACGAAARPGGYVVEKVLVANAHGRMYVARDADGKQVALKELAFVQSPGADAVAAFEREAKFLRALEHPAIPRFVAAFEEGDGVHTRYYLAQELVAGDSLEAKLDDHFYAEAEIIALARKVLDVLVYLQGLSPMVIHRDIKPANIIVRADGSIAVVDFGAAHVQGTTAGSTSIGTFGYMPIEQLAGQVDATTDVYALGATLVHLLTRQEPWRVMNADVMSTINVSAKLRGFLSKLVAPRREDRFPTAAAALAGLDAKPERRLVMPWRYVGWAATAAIALAGAGAVGFAMHGNSAAAPERARLGSAEPWEAAVWTPDSWAAPQWPNPYVRVPKVGVVPPVPPVPPTPPVPPIPPDPPAPPRAIVLSDEHAFVEPKKVSVDFKATQIGDVLRFFAGACDANVVLPSYVQGKVTLKLDQVPCSQALEVVLEAHGLWYHYIPEAKLLQIAARKELEEDAEVFIDAGAPALPDGPKVDLDLKDAPLHDVLQMIATQGKINIVVPDYVQGKVSLHLAKVPWNTAFESLLESQGLWYRYRESGRIARVAARKELDEEDSDAMGPHR